MDNWFTNMFSGKYNTAQYAETLNKLYFTNPPEYLRYLNDLKSKGYKVLRNNKGKHKVEVKQNDIFNGLF